MGPTARTPIADIYRISDHRIDVHVRSGVRIDGQGIAAVMRERQRVCQDQRVGALLLLPPELDLDLSIMNVDHYKVNETIDGLIAMAVLAEGTMSETLARLYLAYFPPVFPIQVFMGRTEAEMWLNERISEDPRRT